MCDNLVQKIKLYVSLLEKDKSKLTNEEIDIMFALCRDKEVQEFLSERIKK